MGSHEEEQHISIRDRLKEIMQVHGTSLPHADELFLATSYHSTLFHAALARLSACGAAGLAVCR